MKPNYKSKMISELVAMIQKENLRVFVAERGDYGFYTNAKGKRVVSFQLDPCLSFSGNYKSLHNGTGWRIAEGILANFASLLETNSPFEFEHYTTLAEYLNMYQKSSKFKEVMR